MIRSLRFALLGGLLLSGLAHADVAFKDTHDAAMVRGKIVFSTYCILCHGVNADGKGRAAKLYNPPPANLTASDKNTQYKKLIVSKGGEAMGRSKFMPPWGEELTVEQIDDVVAYLDSVVVKQ